MTTTYTYIDDDRIERVEYGDGSSVNYTYDAARRLTVIDHVDSGEDTFLKLEYDYTADGLPASITETVGRDVVAVVEFTYDARRRLVSENRTADDPDTEYDLAYEYDAGGNRTKKIDNKNDLEVVYFYDNGDVQGYETFNNRLMAYETYDVAGESSTLISTTWYYYNAAGNPTRIVIEQAGTPGVYSATRFEYAKNGQAVTFVLGETWNEDGPDGGNCPDDYTVTFAREFRYDGGRQRYLNRELDADDLNLSTPVFTVVSETWTDYDGDEPYGDWEIDNGNPVNARSFSLGIATVDPFASSGASNTKYFHADMIGTTRSMSAGGTATESAVYTAFGERIDGTNHRYGYAGSWGYQSHDGVPYLHVGARYYDQTSGRFLQRDPIGISGGLNVYCYVRNNPLKSTDATGLHDTGLPWFVDVGAALLCAGIGVTAPWSALGLALLYVLVDNIDFNNPPNFPTPNYAPADTDGDGIPNGIDGDPFGFRDPPPYNPRPTIPVQDDWDQDGIPNQHDSDAWGVLPGGPYHPRG